MIITYGSCAVCLNKKSFEILDLRFVDEAVVDAINLDLVSQPTTDMLDFGSL